MIGRILGAILALAASGAVWYAYDQITLLRRTFWWEYRYLVLLVSAILILSLADWIINKISGLLSKDDTH